MGILLLENRNNPYGAHGVMGMIVITVVCAWVATPFCVVNVVLIATSREVKPPLRTAFLLLNLSFPLAIAAVVLSHLL